MTSRPRDAHERNKQLNAKNSLDALDKAIEEEDARDAQAPDEGREEITTYEGFANGIATPRNLGGVPYEDFKD